MQRFIATVVKHSNPGLLSLMEEIHLGKEDGK
jgi:hypothetical protein